MATSEDQDTLYQQLRDALRPAYLLLRRLGEGGMGAVYLAREPALKRDVAVKVMLPWLARDPTARARFEREAQAVAAITHPHVINVYGTGELPDGTPYFVMQFVSGRSLEERLRSDGALGLREARRILAEVAAALTAAHARGIVHRDIKAANVLQDAESGRVVVTDFGIAAVLEQGQVDTRLTQPDMGSPGTPHYMAPEQLAGEPSTEKSDVYAFGLLAYELISGAGPFRATSPHEIAAAHLRDLPAPLSKLRGDVDEELEHLVSVCLAKDPVTRPAAAQVVKQLAPGDDILLEWPPPGLEPVAGRLPRVNRRLGFGGTLLALAILGLVLTDPDGSSPVPLWMLESLAIVSGVVLINGVAVAARVRRGMRRALRAGYTWTTILEVVADRRGDTGALITGTREYATLTPDQRGRLRAGRLLTAACAFAAAVAPMPSLLILLRLGAAGAVGSAWLAPLLLLPTIGLLIAAALLRRSEDRAVRRRRAARTRPNLETDLSKKAVAAWNETFVAARTGQTLGTSPPRPMRTRAVVATVLLVAVVALVGVIPLALVNPFGTMISSVATPRFGRTLARIRQADAARAFAPPRDAAIDPQAAGRGLQALVVAGDTTAPAGTMAPAQSLPRFIPVDTVHPLRDLAREQDSLLRLAARRALTRDQVRALEALERHPGWPAFVVVARAPDIDVPGTRYQAAYLDTVPGPMLWLPRFALVRDAGYARVGLAALRLHQGRPAEAETMLRETAGVGLALVDHGISLLDVMVGARMATNALERLTTFYEVTGSAGSARRARAERDSAAARGERDADALDARSEARYGAGIMPAVRAAIRAIVSDSTLPPGFRWDFVGWMGFQSCLNAREIVFGPSPEYRRVREDFIRQLVRSPADSALLLAHEAGLARALGGGPGSVMHGLGAGFAGLLGTPRLERCIAFVGAGF